jgi:hypothetical protein
MVKEISTSQLQFSPLTLQYVDITPYGLKAVIEMKVRKGNNKITELRTILQRESQNS